MELEQQCSQEEQQMQEPIYGCVNVHKQSMERSEDMKSLGI